MDAIPILILVEAIPLWAYLLATFIASGGIWTLVTLWLNRGKPRADIHESRARAAKEWAEADEIRLRGTLTLSEEAGHWTQKMMKAQRLIFQLQAENEQLRNDNRRLRANERKEIGGGR